MYVLISNLKYKIAILKYHIRFASIYIIYLHSIWQPTVRMDIYICNNNRKVGGFCSTLALTRFYPLAFLPRYGLPPRNGLQADTIHALGILAC